MTAKLMIPLACIAALTLGAASIARAQETGKSKDAALDSLLDDLKKDTKDDASAPKAAVKKAEPARPKSQTGAPGPAQKSKEGAGASPGGGKPGSAAAQSKPAPKAPKTKTLAPKDQALDDLLGKLGESKDEPAREERPQNQGPGSARGPKESARENEGAKLGGKDKEIDARLEELAGRRRKRARGDDQERTGPVGEMIKEMRDVEQRLGKPDPSEDTQAKQKQIIKKIDTLIEQVRQSGSSAGRLTMRRRQQRGNQPGEQDGDQPGALAQGARQMKPAKPTSQHSTAGGKGVWGHLPDELREIMDNTFKEQELSSKAELISRYFLSVGKGKLVREGE
jgi:hypothetical protein